MSDITLGKIHQCDRCGLIAGEPIVCRQGAHYRCENPHGCGRRRRLANRRAKEARVAAKRERMEAR